MAGMISTILRNVVGTPVTRRYPFEKRDAFPSARGRLTIDILNCAFCGACERKCPANAIHVDRQNRQLTFEAANCIICGSCADACPRDSLKIDDDHQTPLLIKQIQLYQGVKPAPKPVAAKTPAAKVAPAVVQADADPAAPVEAPAEKSE